MTTEQRYDLVVVGGGAGGIAAARTGVRLGRRTALVQDGRVGGDCTFTGCVPSKTLIESAAHGRPFDEAMPLVHQVVEHIADTESADVLGKEGIDVVEGRARFVGAKVLAVGDLVLRAERMVVATGSAPATPPIPGLAEVRYLTNETVFDLSVLPQTLAVLGGGPVGCELAQAFARLGSRVHLVEAEGRLLPRQEPEASAVIADVLAAEGIVLHLGASVTRARTSAERNRHNLVLADGTVIEADELLVATGRRPVTDGLHPGAGAVALDGRGFIRTDRYLRTSAPGVYAVGDVTGHLAFTHVADEMGRLAVHNAFGRVGRRPFDANSIPQVVFTDPEVARVGLVESDAHDRHGARVAFLPMEGVDRAIAAQRTEGFVKLVAGPRRLLGRAGGGLLLGATVVAPRAGEMIHEAALAMRTKMFTGRLAQTVHAYPTWSTAIRQAAAQFFFEVDGRSARPARRFEVQAARRSGAG